MSAEITSVNLSFWLIVFALSVRSFVCRLLWQALDLSLTIATPSLKLCSKLDIRGFVIFSPLTTFKGSVCICICATLHRCNACPFLVLFIFFFTVSPMKISWFLTPFILKPTSMIQSSLRDYTFLIITINTPSLPRNVVLVQRWSSWIARENHGDCRPARTKTAR